MQMFNKKRIKELEAEVKKWEKSFFVELGKVIGYISSINLLEEKNKELADQVALYKQKYLDELEKRLNLAEKLEHYAACENTNKICKNCVLHEENKCKINIGLWKDNDYCSLWKKH